MKRILSALLAFSLAAGGAVAAAPGVIDGQDIPTDFANASLVALQTNRTGVGDVTALEVVPSYSEGTELDALYLAKDNSYLYVGIAGNLLEVGNPFIILIDNPFADGQTELRTEGVGGPPFALQFGGREVIVDTNGTPLDGTDDTYTVTPNSGMLLPTCGDGGFTGWDYALALDGAGGVLYGHEYQLRGFSVATAQADEVCHFNDGRGRVACDPTPDNAADALMPVYAERYHVLESPIGDGNDIFEGGDAGAGYQRGGFVNANTTGVTETSASMAGAALTGVEVSIPMSRVGDGGIFPSDTIHILILTMDADEYNDYGISGGFGTVINQALPAFGAGSGVCDPADNLGMRPDLSTLACLTVDLTTVDTISPTAVLEGVIDPADYDGGAPAATQTCPTSAGDQVRTGDLLLPVEDGSELNALYADNDDAFLYLGMTGNLQAGGTSINVFIDADPAVGEHVVDFQPGSSVYNESIITNFSDFHFSGRYQQWAMSSTITSGPTDYRIQSTDFGGGFFDIDPNLNAAGATTLELDLTLNPANEADAIVVILSDEDGTERRFLFDGLIANTTYNLSMPLSSYSSDQSIGSVPGLDLTDLSFFHLAGTFSVGSPGIPLDMTFDRLALVGVTNGASAVVTLNGDQLANGPLDVLENGHITADASIAYDVAYGINISESPRLAYVDFFDLVSDTFTFRGAVVPDGGDSALFDDPGGLVASNPNGLAMAFNNQNTDGVIGCEDNAACFLEDSATVAARARTAGSGVELAIPLADLGLSAIDLPRIIHVWTMVADELGSASDQSLPSMRNATVVGNQVSVPGNAPINFTDPTAPAGTTALLSDFSDFELAETYGNWPTATFTSGLTDFRVESTDWGGGLYDMSPPVDASGATDLVIDLTLNPANLTDKLVVVLVDADGTERVFRFENLTNGEQTLSVELSRYINDNVVGTVPGLDLTNLTVFHLGGAFHHGDPGVALDMTFDNLALVGAPRNYEARAARICLGTVTGDGDCDGDNDLADFALIQQCVGISADPVLPTECELLDFVKDQVIDDLDIAGFVTVLDGP